MTRNYVAGTLNINQSSFIQNLIENKNMTNCNLVSISMKKGYFIKILESGNYKKVDIKPYQCLIGKLMYLSYGTRPDITFAVG